MKIELKIMILRFTLVGTQLKRVVYQVLGHSTGQIVQLHKLFNRMQLFTTRTSITSTTTTATT